MASFRACVPRYQCSWMNVGRNWVVPDQCGTVKKTRRILVRVVGTLVNGEHSPIILVNQTANARQTGKNLDE